MAKEDTAVLERELHETKTYASELSAANERSKKEIGNLRKSVEATAALEAENKALKAALAEAQAQNRALEAGLAKANAAAEAGDKAVAAGKAIKDALGQLSSL